MGELEQRNKAIVRTFLASLSSGDIETGEALCDDRLVWWMPFDPAYSALGGKRSKAEMIAQMRRAQGPVSGFVLTIKSMTAEADRVAVEAEGAADTPAGPYANRYHFAFQLENGKIVYGGEYLDSAYLNAFQAKLAAVAAPSP